MGRNSRKKLVSASRPQKSGPLIKKDKRVEERLRKLNETLTVLFRFAPDAIIVVDERGCIVRINDQARAMFGYTAKEFVGKRIEMLMPSRFRKRHVGHQKRYMAEPRLREMGAGLELYAQRKDGSEFPVDIMLSPIETSEGRSAIAIVRDVTEHRRIEETLRKSREELEVRVQQRTAELTQATASALAALEARTRQHDAVAELSQRALEGRDLVHFWAMRFLWCHGSLELSSARSWNCSQKEMLFCYVQGQVGRRGMSDTRRYPLGWNRMEASPYCPAHR